jgi:hypothetical protein
MCDDRSCRVIVLIKFIVTCKDTICQIFGLMTAQQAKIRNVRYVYLAHQGARLTGSCAIDIRPFNNTLKSARTKSLR